jgi:hypothetical protein
MVDAARRGRIRMNYGIAAAVGTEPGHTFGAVGTRVLVVIVAGIATLLVASAAMAKEFRPGDLRLCSGHRCVAITKLRRLAAPLHPLRVTRQSLAKSR